MMRGMHFTRLGDLLVLGLACWVSTTIVVESELCRPLREWIADRAFMSEQKFLHAPCPNRSLYTRMMFWKESCYVVGCHMCTGVWVAFVLVAVTGARTGTGGLAGLVIATLAVKAIAHLVLELRPQAWGDR